MPARRWCLILAASGLIAGTVQADDEAVAIEPREAWSNVFGDKEVVFHFRVKADKAFKGRVSWALSHEQRSLVHGEAAVAVDPPKPADVTVRLAIPPVKEGVVFAGKLALNVAREGQAGAVAKLEKTLWIFPASPFVDRSQWLKQLKITLFDPAKRTADVFREMRVPFAQTGTVAGLAEVKEGMLIVGEGASFKEHPELAEVLVKAAARGLPVLCLVPSEGSFAVPGENPRLPAPGRRCWNRQSVVTELDKRLDALAWPGDTALVRSSLVLKADDGVVAAVAPGAKGWAWLEADYPEHRGKLVICGLGIIEAWDRGPTPRFLLGRILEVMNPPAGENRP